MKWANIESLTKGVPPPEGYKYALPTQSQIPTLIQAVDEWFPGLAVGNASCYLREDFYKNRVFFEDNHECDFFLMLFKQGQDWAGMLSVERDKDNLYALSCELGHGAIDATRCCDFLKNWLET